MQPSLALTRMHANRLLTGPVDHLKIVCCNLYPALTVNQIAKYWPTFFARAVRACSPNILIAYIAARTI